MARRGAARRTPYGDLGVGPAHPPAPCARRRRPRHPDRRCRGRPARCRAAAGRHPTPRALARVVAGRGAGHRAGAGGRRVARGRRAARGPTDAGDSRPTEAPGERAVVGRHHARYDVPKADGEGRRGDGDRLARHCLRINRWPSSRARRRMRVMPQQLSIDLGDDATLRAEQWPGEGPTVVLLHAGIADRRSWQSTAALLAPRHVVTYDQRGFGESSSAAAKFRHTDDLCRVLDVVSPKEPAYLVGSSMGGKVTLDLTLQHPERVAGLVLLAPAVSGAPGVEDVDAETQRLGDLLEAAMDSGDLDEVNRLETWLWLHGPPPPRSRRGWPPPPPGGQNNRRHPASGGAGGRRRQSGRRLVGARAGAGAHH